MKYFILQTVPSPTTAEAPTDFMKVEPVRLGDAPCCPKCGSATGMLKTLPPVRGTLKVWTSKPGDVAMSPGGALIVSERFWKCCQHRGFTGLDLIGTVELTKIKHGKLAAPVPQYICCSVARSRAAVDAARSGLMRTAKEVCPECRIGGIIKRWKRVLLEEGTWSGEDIFTARGLPGTVIVTERFADMCKECGLVNCNLVPAETYGHDFYPWEPVQTQQ